MGSVESAARRAEAVAALRAVLAVLERADDEIALTALGLHCRTDAAFAEVLGAIADAGASVKVEDKHDVKAVDGRPRIVTHRFARVCPWGSVVNVWGPKAVDDA